MMSAPGQTEGLPGRETARLVRTLANSYAEDGEPLEALYVALDENFDARGGAEQADLLRLASMTWADAFVTRLNRLTCADPLTGLASVHHLLPYLEGAARRSGGTEGLVLLVIDVVSRRDEADDVSEERLGRGLRLALVADTLAALEDPSTIRVAVGPRRVALLVDWEIGLARRAEDLAAAINRRFRLTPDGHVARVQVVPLPAELAAAVGVIEELGSPDIGGHGDPQRAGSGDARKESAASHVSDDTSSRSSS